MTLSEVAKKLDRALTETASLLEAYMAAAKAEAVKGGRDSTDGGMSAAQLRPRLKAFVISKLSPKPHYRLVEGKSRRIDSVIELDGAPDARRYIAARGLPGLK